MTTLTKKDFVNMICKSKKVIKHYYNYKQFNHLQYLTNEKNFKFDNAKILLNSTDPAQVEKHSKFIIINGGRLENTNIKKVIFTSKDNINIFLVLFNTSISCLYITSY